MKAVFNNIIVAFSIIFITSDVTQTIKLSFTLKVRNIELYNNGDE